jgi:spore maturation protein CgeB
MWGSVLVSHKLRIIYLAHSLRSDWNNGNAHFLRGLLREMGLLGHRITVLEPAHGWSIENLAAEAEGARSLSNFSKVYPELDVRTYAEDEGEEQWRTYLVDADLVILHEWNPPALAQRLLKLRKELRYKLVFHDTHHRASSSPTQMHEFGLLQFDAILAFGEALRTIYRQQFGISKVWTLHEAADVEVFRPITGVERDVDLVWIGNWGEGERSQEIQEFLLKPAASLSPAGRCIVYGVRYPEEGLQALRLAGIDYRGYLANLDAPKVYASARLTIHIPRQQYTSAMIGIPTIRVFEALACGIPLVSAPWTDAEELFRPEDICFALDSATMTEAMKRILNDPESAAEQAALGRETVLARHTCAHRALELTDICEEWLQ